MINKFFYKDSEKYKVDLTLDHIKQVQDKIKLKVFYGGEAIDVKYVIHRWADINLNIKYIFIIVYEDYKKKLVEGAFQYGY